MSDRSTIHYTPTVSWRSGDAGVQRWRITNYPAAHQWIYNGTSHHHSIALESESGTARERQRDRSVRDR